MCRRTRPSETGRAAVAGAAMGAAPTAFPHEPQNCAPGVRAVPHLSQNMECPSSTKPYAKLAAKVPAPLGMRTLHYSSPSPASKAELSLPPACILVEAPKFIWGGWRLQAQRKNATPPQNRFSHGPRWDCTAAQASACVPIAVKHQERAGG